jgi:DNA polymerase III epsilon subunit-like protein
MTAWHEKQLCVLDLETTAAEPDEARLVTAAVGYVGGGKPTDIVTLIAAPEGFDIPDEAAAIHGWTTERAREEGRPLGEVLDIVLGYLDHRPEGGAVVAYNAPYDLTVLDREARRLGVPGLEAERPLRVVCPLLLDRHLGKYRPGSRKLHATCQLYGVTLDAPHKAHSDALNAGRLAWKLGKYGEVRRRVRDADEQLELEGLRAEWTLVKDDLEKLHAFEQAIFKVQARELEEYFHRGNARKGVPPQPERKVPRDWPVFPLGWQEPRQAALDLAAAMQS